MWIPVVCLKKARFFKNNQHSENRRNTTGGGFESARTTAAALQLFDRKGRRILHEDLKFYPYKLVEVQKSKIGDLPKAKQTCDRLFKMYLMTPLSFSAMKLLFICQDV